MGVVGPKHPPPLSAENQKLVYTHLSEKICELRASFLDFFSRKGEFEQIQKFGTLFVKILGELGCTKVFQKF